MAQAAPGRGQIFVSGPHDVKVVALTMAFDLGKVRGVTGMIRRAAILGLLLLACLSCSKERRTDITGSAELLRSAGLKRAKDEGKQLFVLFTSQGCEWCERYDQFHADNEVSRVLGKHLVMLKIDVFETPGGMHMYQEYGGTNTVPEFSILDASGMLLANSGEGEAKIGFPAKPREIERYFAALKTACPSLSEEDANLLSDKLSMLRPEEMP
jgi:Thioredoxin-like